ncbi:MAG: hypothetical protein WBG86_11895 [Polyangiales bacterium]
MNARLGVVLASAAMVLSACGDDAFEISDAEYPDTVVSDGARGNLTISWSGNPTFPITAVFGPAEGGCPAGVDCLMPEQAFQEVVNPIVFVDSPRCFGVTEQVVFGYQIQLTDAEGVVTEPYPAPFTCLPE